MMTVRELILALQSLDGDTVVVVDGYEWGFDTPHVRAAQAVLHPEAEGQEDWEGIHEEVDAYANDEDKAKATSVVVISRSSVVKG